MALDIHRVPVRHKPRTRTSILIVLGFEFSSDDILQKPVAKGKSRKFVVVKSNFDFECQVLMLCLNIWFTYCKLTKERSRMNPPGC